jgi:hypothetical protein
VVIGAARQVTDYADARDCLQAVNDIGIGHHDPEQRLAANNAEISLSLYDSGEPPQLDRGHVAENRRRADSALPADFAARVPNLLAARRAIGAHRANISTPIAEALAICGGEGLGAFRADSGLRDGKFAAHTFDSIV